MKIYFEDGELTEPNSRNFRYRYLIDAGYGFTKNNSLLNLIKEIDDKSAIYTNSLLALNNDYAWNDELGVPEIYIRNSNGNFTRIDKLTHKALRKAHCIMKMYITGAFRNEV